MPHGSLDSDVSVQIMKDHSRPLLSVTIPTWNRSQFLKKMVLSVTTQAERYGLVSDVEVVISDNASTDDTPSVVADLQAQTPVRINYHRNDVNLGAIKNIVKTLELSCGHYWMLYGDDDLMVDGALPLILNALRGHPEATLFIFEQEGGIIKLSPTGGPALLSIAEAARQHLYYIGNAGVFAVRTNDAQAQLARYGLERFTGTCWPQTQLAFAALALNQQPTPVLAVPIASSRSPYHGGNTIYTSWYLWETTFFALYRAALDLRSITGHAFFEAACAHLFSPRRVLRTARDVALYATFYDLPDDVAQFRRAAWRSLAYARGRALVPLMLMWLIAVAPRTLKMLCLYAVMWVRHPRQARSRFRRLHESIRAHKSRRLGASKGGVEQPRVYTSGDL